MSIGYLDPVPSTLIRCRQTMTGCKSIRDLTSFLTTHLAIFQILQGVWELEANEIGEGIAIEIADDQSVNRSPQASDHSDMPCTVWGWCWLTLDARRRVSPPWHHILLWDVCGISSTSMNAVISRRAYPAGHLEWSTQPLTEHNKMFTSDCLKSTDRQTGLTWEQ